jgi:hypothetical protein
MGALGAQIKRAATQTNTKQTASTSAASGGSPGATAAAVAATASDADHRPNSRVIDRETTSAVAIDLLRGKTDDATARLAADTGLQPAEATGLIQSLSPQVEKYKAQVKEAADQARRYTAAAMWALFFSCLIGLVAAALGGWAGAGHIHRVHDQRVYP